MIEEFYKKINGDYINAISRMNNDDRIKKYLNFFLADESYSQLVNALKEDNAEAAFNAAHTLKGVSQNLAFTEFGKLVEEITEELRNKNLTKAKTLIDAISISYENIVNEIKNIL